MSHLYVKQSTNDVVSITDIRTAFPRMSIPDGADLSFLGYARFVGTLKPTPDLFHRVVEAAPVNNIQTWAQVPLANDEIEALFVAALEAHYDARAQEKRYDNRLTCALRAGYAGPFQAEGQSFAIWMDTCNAYAYQQLDRVVSGQRALPTPAQLIAELPVLTW